MVGYALRKIAKEYNLTLEDGIAYGNYRGFAATFSEGMGSKTVCFTGRFPSEAAELAVGEMIRSWDWEKNRMEQVGVNRFGVQIEFFDNPGTMTCINRILDKLIPLLEESGFADADHCAACGGAVVEDDIWNTDDGNAYHIHRSCSSELKRDLESIEKEVEAEEEAEAEAEIAAEEEKNGYGFGMKGAAIGGVIGAVITAVLYAFFDEPFIAALLVGLISNFFYDHFCGRNSFLGALIVLVSAVVFFSFGLCVGDILYYGMEIFNGNLAISVSELFDYWISMISSEDYFVPDLLWGYLGVFLTVDVLFIRAFMFHRKQKR